MELVVQQEPEVVQQEPQDFQVSLALQQLQQAVAASQGLVSVGVLRSCLLEFSVVRFFFFGSGLRTYV